jgi:hypothetical protein
MKMQSHQGLIPFLGICSPTGKQDWNSWNAGAREYERAASALPRIKNFFCSYESYQNASRKVQNFC